MCCFFFSIARLWNKWCVSWRSHFWFVGSWNREAVLGAYYKIGAAKNVIDDNQGPHGNNREVDASVGEDYG